MGWHSWYQSIDCLQLIHLHFCGSAWVWKSLFSLLQRYLCLRSKILEVNLLLKSWFDGSRYWERRISQNFGGTSFSNLYSSIGDGLFLMSFSWCPVNSIDKLTLSKLFVGFSKMDSENGLVPLSKYVMSVELDFGTCRYLFQNFKWTLSILSSADLLILEVQIAAQYS